MNIYIMISTILFNATNIYNEVNYLVFKITIVTIIWIRAVLKPIFIKIL